MSEVGRDHGLILHAAAKTDDGFMVVNLWPSQQESEAAARDPRRLAVIERADIQADEIRRVHHEVSHFRAPRLSALPRAISWGGGAPCARPRIWVGRGARGRWVDLRRPSR